MVLEEAPDRFEDPAQLLGGRLVAEADRREQPDAVPHREVLDLDLGEVRVRDRQDRWLQGAQPRRPQPDVLHRADLVAEPAEVADANGLIDAESEPAEHVRDRLLRCERDRGAADPDAGEQPADVESRLLEDRYDEEEEDGALRRAPSEDHERDAGALALPLEARADAMVEEI